ncbi:hypothetical protein [Caulobacter sp. RL271]|jgi:hypothetical protein|uniref:Uncharacterized protein n=1 Tax=Caulobacter segnis TaxID=88688 RepID=A0ABY4ZW62_9CAUL|nr:hypothetical protein [Caulobacter segnis]USQ96806.1 hypothetical protein MZV50_04330 [Caulobacter segnis]
MATTYQYLLRRKTELETRMIEAQRRAQAPFESELRAIVLALDALKQAGMAERLSGGGEQPSFAPAQPPAPSAPTPSKRGRRGRTTRDMILMALAQAPGLNEAEIARQLDHRWSRPVTPVQVGRELEQLETEGLAKRSGPGWIRLEKPVEETEELPSLSVAVPGY